MSELTALFAATLFAALVVFSVIGGGVKDTAARMFDRNPADFSAKFIRP